MNMQKTIEQRIIEHAEANGFGKVILGVDENNPLSVFLCEYVDYAEIGYFLRLAKPDDNFTYEMLEDYKARGKILGRYARPSRIERMLGVDGFSKSEFIGKYGFDPSNGLIIIQKNGLSREEILVSLLHELYHSRDNIQKIDDETIYTDEVETASEIITELRSVISLGAIYPRNLRRQKNFLDIYNSFHEIYLDLNAGNYEVLERLQCSFGDPRLKMGRIINYLYQEFTYGDSDEIRKFLMSAKYFGGIKEKDRDFSLKQVLRAIDKIEKRTKVPSIIPMDLNEGDYILGYGEK